MFKYFSADPDVLHSNSARSKSKPILRSPTNSKMDLTMKTPVIENDAIINSKREEREKMVKKKSQHHLFECILQREYSILDLLSGKLVLSASQATD